MIIVENTIKTIEQKALDILSNYEGSNNYLLKLQNNLKTNKKFYPTRAQSDYILNYHTTNPKVAKKWVDLDFYFSKKFADEKLLVSIPKQLWVEKILVEKDTSYHIWGKFFSGDTIQDMWVPKSAIIKSNRTEPIEIDYIKYEHRPPLSHQKEAIEKLTSNKKFILADDMGLGKTTSTIISSIETKSKKILIVCPASLKINWFREIQNYTDRSIYICEGKKYEDADFVIVNYDIIKNFHDPKNKEESILLKSNFDLVILDECHYIKNSQAIRTKLVNDFVKNVDRLWLLTGTPITSRPIDYYNLLRLVDSPVSLNWQAYVIRYCGGYQFRVGGNKKIWNTNGATNLDELRERTSLQILRRLKENVLDLPEKIITPVYLKLKSKEYEELMGEYFDWYRNKRDESSSLTIQFSKLMKVRQVIANEKVESTIELCENILEQDKKVIIFCNFTESLNKIVEHFGKSAVKVDGSMSKTERQHSVDEFQDNPKVKVFVGNIKAAGVGLTLTSAEAVIMNDLSFLPSDHSQAEDRAYRYGQKNNVLVYYPIFENTIEGIIYDILNAKKQVISTVMGDNVNSADYAEEILRRINELRH